MKTEPAIDFIFCQVSAKYFALLLCNKEKNFIYPSNSMLMQIKRTAVFFTLLLASAKCLYAQTEPDSLSLKRSEIIATMEVRNSQWLEMIIPDVRIKWLFQDDSTFFRTAIWPEDGPEFDIGKYKIDKKNNTFSIQWGFQFFILNKQTNSYSIPQPYTIIKMTENEIILRKQVSKEDKTNGLSGGKNYIRLVKVY